MGAANGLDNVQLASTATAFVTALDLPPAVAAGGVAKASGVAAFLLDPTPERMVNVVTMGSFRVLKMTARGSSEALETVEKVEKSNDAAEILTATQQHLQQQQHPNDKFLGS